MNHSVSPQLDRLLISAVDVVDGERTASDSGEDRRAVSAALIQLLDADGPPTRDARLTIVVHRLARWTTRALHVLARAPVRTSPEQITGTWGVALTRGGSTVDDVLWTTATAVVDAVVERRLRRRHHEDTLAGVLAEICPPIPAGDRLGPWRFGPVSGRPARYELRASFEAGSGALLWSANEATRRRWAGAVDHYDLAIPWGLADRVQQMLDRYDDTDPRLRPLGRGWGDGEHVRFGQGFAAVCDELEAALGSAYRIVERRQVPEPSL